MRCNQKFLLCKICGNLIGIIKDESVPLVCCGQEMTLLVPNTEEASTEKHLPAIAASGSSISVQVGSTFHPMEEGHHITFVYVETENGGQRKCLDIGAEPKVTFCFDDDKPVAVYAYCNLHGLWKTEV